MTIAMNGWISLLLGLVCVLAIILADVKKDDHPR